MSQICFTRGLRKDCQMLLFSATYDVNVMKFAQAIVPHPVVIRLRREEESLNNIKQYYITCTSQEAKFEALSNIYGTISIGQSMIFCHVSILFKNGKLEMQTAHVFYTVLLKRLKFKLMGCFIGCDRHYLADGNVSIFKLKSVGTWHRITVIWDPLPITESQYILCCIASMMPV